jgi:hypothetical protein
MPCCNLPQNCLSSPNISPPQQQPINPPVPPPILVLVSFHLSYLNRFHPHPSLTKQQHAKDAYPHTEISNLSSYREMKRGSGEGRGKGKEMRYKQKVASQSPLTVPARTAVVPRNMIPRLKMLKIVGGLSLHLGVFSSSNISSDMNFSLLFVSVISGWG